MALCGRRGPPALGLLAGLAAALGLLAPPGALALGSGSRPSSSPSHSSSAEAAPSKVRPRAGALTRVEAGGKLTALEPHVATRNEPETPAAQVATPDAPATQATAPEAPATQAAQESQATTPDAPATQATAPEAPATQAAQESQATTPDAPETQAAASQKEMTNKVTYTASDDPFALDVDEIEKRKCPDRPPLDKAIVSEHEQHATDQAAPLRKVAESFVLVMVYAKECEERVKEGFNAAFDVTSSFAGTLQNEFSTSTVLVERTEAQGPGLSFALKHHPSSLLLGTLELDPLQLPPPPEPAALSEKFDKRCKEYGCSAEEVCMCLRTDLTFDFNPDIFDAALQNVIFQSWMGFLSKSASSICTEGFYESEWHRQRPHSDAGIPDGWGPATWMQGMVTICGSDDCLTAISKMTDRAPKPPQSLSSTTSPRVARRARRRE